MNCSHTYTWTCSNWLVPIICTPSSIGGRGKLAWHPGLGKDWKEKRAKEATSSPLSTPPIFPRAHLQRAGSHCNSEFTQQDGRKKRKKRTAKGLWKAYYLCFFVWSSLKLTFSGLLQNDLFKGGWSSAEKFFKQNYCHACHTRFAVSFLSRPVAQAH